jgi:hypothetical protein
MAPMKSTQFALQVHLNVRRLRRRDRRVLSLKRAKKVTGDSEVPLDDGGPVSPL